MTTSISLEDISVLDKQIDQLMDYKPIPEHEIKALCDKVSASHILSLSPIFCIPSFNIHSRQRKFYQRKAMFNQLGVQ